MTKAELQEQALRLSASDRRSLGMVLIDSTLPPLSVVQKRLIDERLATYEADPDSWLNQEQFDTELDECLARS